MFPVAEAEPLMRRAVGIIFKFMRDTGHQHPDLRTYRACYAGLLQQMGYSDHQVRTKLHELAGQYGVSLDE
jgi:hypothetical protein